MKKQNIKIKHPSLLKHFYFFNLLKKMKWVIGKIPIFICILFFILSLIPINNCLINQKPPLFLIPFFYWMVKKPENMGLLYVLIIAFVYDILDNNFFGVNIFLIMIIYSFLLYQKFIPINKNYITHYITYSLVTLFYYATKYTIYLYMFNTKSDIMYVAFNYLIILILYHILYGLMNKIKKFIE